MSLSFSACETWLTDTHVDQLLEIDTSEVLPRRMLSAFSGLAVLCVLTAVLIGSTFIASGEGAQTRQDYGSLPDTFQGDPAPAESMAFCLVDSESNIEQIRQSAGFVAAEAAQTPWLPYPSVMTLLARTPEEEALAYATIVEAVRASQRQPLHIEIIDLRGLKPE
jgi:hypothetical protein